MKHPTYEVRYTNEKGQKVRAKSEGENALDALEKYGARLAFGTPIFCGRFHTKMIDADTQGRRWGTFSTPGVNGDIYISVEVSMKAV